MCIRMLQSAVTMRVLYWVAVTAVLLHFLAVTFAVRVEDDARMPPGKSLGDHMCIHDKIAQDHLPTVQTKDGGHEKRFAGGFSPIRITPHFIEPLSSTFRSQLIGQTGVLMKVLSLISQTLLVRPISGGFTIPPECDEYTYGANIGKCRVMHTNTQCGSYTVPRQFVGKREVCSSSSGSCYSSGPDGGGVANTDFLLFVGTQSPLLLLLPVLGTNGTDHLLATSPSVPHFHDGSLNFYRPYTSGSYSNSPITGLNSSKVLQVARNYFGCKDLPYVPLENNGGRGSVSSHWEARVLHHETMAPFLSNDYSVFSNFTLAFFEDSGWYQVNYTFINNYEQFQLQWGKGQGCDFVLEPCDNPNTYPYLCDTAVPHQCTFDRVSRGSCKTTYTFFDGCPVVVAEDDTACMYSVNTPVPNYGSEVYGDDSICVEVNTTLGDCLPRGGTPRCYQRQVVQQNGTNELAFSINIHGSTHWCRDSEVLRTNNGFLFCPSRDEILLRVATEDISSVQTLSAPENVVAANMTSGSNISANISLLEACPVPEIQVCSHGDIRLVGGLTQYEGRVEVCKNEEWGTVCDDGWGTTDAQVVCRQLGYETQGARAYLSAYFGQGVGDIHLTYVRCSGTESRLLSCGYSTPSRYSCSHYEDAGVRCPGPCLHGSVRVIGRYGTMSRQGNVELCVDGSWKTLCANSWDNRDASVVCRQIGYSPFGAVAREDDYPTLYPNHRFVNTELQCSGLESNVTNCTQNLNETFSCLSFGVASVSCHSGILPNASCFDGAVRLRNGYLVGEGRLEVCINNAWGTVCDDGWDNADASVVCRQLGYYSVGNASRFASFGQGRGPILLEYVHCNGFEKTLLECDNNGLGYSTCGHYEDAGVICQANPNPIDCTLGDVRLTNGSSRLEGRVEVCFGNLWGTICHNSWDNRDAGVICKQLFNSSFGGHAINGSKFGGGDVPIVIENINCNGTEDSLTDCSTITSISNTISSCSGSNVAGIVCYVFHEGESGTCSSGAVRLADGLTKFEGRVEICYDNRWGGVCGSSWDVLEATVVCRQLGYIYFGATAFSNSYFGVGFRPHIMQVTSCLGSENSLLTCSHTQLGFNPNCNATNEVGVRCIDPSNACTHGAVRLIGGTNQYQGRVEVCFHGAWGTVCNRWSWDTVDATVVCRQLGFQSLGAVSHRYGYFGRGSGPIVIGSVSCRGRETHLLNCSHSSSPSYLRSCSHSGDVGVECPVPSNDTCTTNGDLRLVGGANQYEGRVELCYNGQWGTVCDDLWGTSDAGVACKQLGYSGIGARTFSYAYFGRGTGGIYLDNLGCRGSESRLIDCVHSTIGIHNCDHGDDAGLRCQLQGSDCTHGQIRLRNGPTSREGRVEICVDGTWGTVCDSGWSYNDARVVCRQLGFPTLGTVARSSAYYGRGSGLIMLTNIGCTGEELNLLNCTYYGYGVTSCSHFRDAGVRCPAPLTNAVNCTNGDLRLRGGTTSREGRVEMCYDRQWGTVCDDVWGTTDARVACRQLGFSSYGATSYSNAHFGHGSGPILLDNVGCTGRETRLLDCSKYGGVGLYSLNCGHDDDAGVKCNVLGNECTDGSIRLRGGTSVREGRVEICIEGRWGTVCDNGWDSRDAAVVCRQLGYPSLGTIPRINAVYGRGSGPIWLDYLTCTGNETDLLKCSHNGIGITSYYCGHDDDVGVQCPVSQNVNCTTGAVRLVGGATKHQGRVEICYNNQWGTVCDDLWSNTDARVVCRQLGHTPVGAIAYSNAYFGRGSGGIFLDNVGCSGTESSLLICSNLGIGHHNCDHSADAGVKCLDRTNCNEGEIRLRGGLREGTVEMCLSGIWGTVCDNSWDSRDASVVCKQLGFPVLGAIPVYNAYFGRGTGAILIDYVSCAGNEQFLANCTNNGVGITSSFCNHYQDAGVRCPAPVNATVPCTNGAVRLVGGLSSNQGRVEICYNNQWGTVCDNLFSSTDARVVCRQLGFPAIGATTYSNALFGRGSGGIFLDNVGCRGTESTLFHCVHRGIGVHSCRHSEDVGIKCAVPGNCSDGQIRLRGGLSQREGRVEICISRVWGTICHNLWDNYEAQVVCRQLGYSALGAKSFRSAHFGRGTVPLLLDRLRCTGSEMNLLNCSHSGEGVTASYCSHYSDAGVRCLAPFAPDNCTEGSVRLLFGSTTRSGTVQVCVNRTWGSICDSNWGSQDANVVCRQLGFTTIGAIPRLNSFYGRASGPIWLDNIYCTGRESNILNCRHNGIGILSSLCDSGDHSGVECPVPVTANNCTNGTLRLVGGLTEREGRVEVCYNNQWGTVCDDFWGSPDAGVACKQLGFSYYGATAYTRAYFGRGKGGIFLDNLYCTGRESRLVDCSHSGVGVHNCEHSADAGLRCQVPSCFVDGEIRLRGGTSPREGRVEMCLGGVWGTICDDGWGTTDARVVCRQLGYPTIGALPISRAFFGRGSGPVLIAYVGCNGLESHLANCTRSTAYCSHSEDAGVRCPNRTAANANCTDGQLRLRGGNISREGRVEMCYEHQWGTVCDNRWGISDAKVACRQLGFSSYGAISYSNAFFGQGSGPILLDNVGCTGRESRLLECSNYGGVGLHSLICGHDDDAGVRCNARSNECSDGSIRLRGSSTVHQGRVEICVEGRWGTVCDNSWDSRDAAVVCRQLGYSSLGAIPYSNARFGFGSGPIWLDYLYCNGNEHSLLNCSHRGIGGTSSFCSHLDDVGVQCPAPVTIPVCCTDGDIRLVNGSVASEGRVEICHNKQWGTICDDSFGSFEAAVVCRQLGYSAIGAVGYSFSRFGGGSGGIFLDNLGCYGYESRLLDCTRPTIGVHDCDHGADAGVRCRGSTLVSRKERLCTATATQLSPTQLTTQPSPTQLTTQPSTQLTTQPSTQLTTQPSTQLTTQPSTQLTTQSSTQLTTQPSTHPTIQSNTQPTTQSTTKLIATVKPTPTKAATKTTTHTKMTPSPQPQPTYNLPTQPTSSPASCPTFGVRLVNGTSMYEGRVEMCFNNTWGTICGNKWDAQDAVVVCKQLGFNSTDAVALRGAHFGEGRGPILMEGVYCAGDEKGLHRCFQTRSQPCSHIEDAAVQCSGPSAVPKGIRLVNVSTELLNNAVVTVVMQSNQLLGQGTHSIETVVTIKSYVSSQCSQTDECKCINSSLTDRKRFTRAADINVHVVNLTTTENGKINISLYATLSSEALSADSLKALLKKASAMNATLTQNGISVVEVYRPSGFITTPDQSPGSSSSPFVIVGVLLGAVGGVMLIGALGCMIIAGLKKKKVKFGGDYEAITDHSTRTMAYKTQGTQLNAKIGTTE